MNQQTLTLQTDPGQFRQQLAAMDDNGLNQFIFSVFFEEVGALESEGQAWDQTHSSGQSDDDYLLRMESDFRSRINTVKQNTDALLDEANQRAREYVFQIKWWAQRLNEVERRSVERLTTVQSRTGNAGQAAPEPVVEEPVEQETPVVEAQIPEPPPSQPEIRVETPPQPEQEPTVSPTSALEALRAELSMGPEVSEPLVVDETPTTEILPDETNVLRTEKEELKRQLEAVQDELRAEREMAQGITTSAEQLQSLEAENESLRRDLQAAQIENQGLQRQSQTTEALEAQLHNLQLQLEAEREQAQAQPTASGDEGWLRQQLQRAQEQIQELSQAENRVIQLEAQLAEIRESERAASESDGLDTSLIESLTSENEVLTRRLEEAETRSAASETLAARLLELEAENEELRSGPQAQPQIRDSEEYTALEDEIEALRRQVRVERDRADSLEERDRREDVDRRQISRLRSRLARIRGNTIELAQYLRENLVLIAAETPLSDESEPWAVRERAMLLETLLEEMERQRDEYYSPSVEASWEIIEILKRTGASTLAYEESLEVGNVASVLMLERFLRDQARSANIRLSDDESYEDLVEQLTQLETRVDTSITDIQQRVVPMGLLSIGLKLASETTNAVDAQQRRRTVTNIIGAVRSYVDAR